MYSNIWSQIDNIQTVNFPQQTVNSLLKSESCSFEELLLAEDFIKECSSTYNLNQKLTEFFAKKESIKKLISYLLNLDLPNNSENKSFAIKCNRVISEIPGVLKNLINDIDALITIFTFLEADQIDPFYSGYFKNIVIFLHKNFSSKICDFFVSFGIETIINRFLYHLDNLSIRETLAFLCWDDTSKLNQEWLLGSNLVKNLVNQLSKDKSDEKIMSAGKTLISLISRCFVINKKTPSVHKCLLYQQLETEQHLKFLVQNIFSGNSASISHSLSIFMHITLKICSYFEMKFKAEMNQSDESSDSDFLCHETHNENVEESLLFWYPLLLNRLTDIKNLFLNIDSSFLHLQNTIRSLTNNDPSNNLNPAFFDSLNQMRLGQNRLKIIELIVSLVRLDSKPFVTAIIKSGFLEVVFDAFLLFPWHNYLHNLVNVMICCVLGGNSFALKKHLFNDVPLIRKLAIGIKLNMEHNKLFRCNIGNNGHIFAMLVVLDGQVASNTTIKQFCSEFDEWSFCKSYLVDYSMKNVDIGSEEFKNLKMERNNLEVLNID